MLLSDIRIRSARATGKIYTLNDGAGLRVLVNAKGGKSWQFRYTYLSEKKLLSLGPYPEVTLLEAREKAFAMRKLLVNGIDPQAKKADEAKVNRDIKANTFAIWADC